MVTSMSMTKTSLPYILMPVATAMVERPHFLIEAGSFGCAGQPVKPFLPSWMGMTS